HPRGGLPLPRPSRPPDDRTRRHRAHRLRGTVGPGIGPTPAGRKTPSCVVTWYAAGIDPRPRIAKGPPSSHPHSRYSVPLRHRMAGRFSRVEDQWTRLPWDDRPITVLINGLRPGSHGTRKPRSVSRLSPRGGPVLLDTA